MGRKPKELALAPTLPAELNYVWVWFRGIVSHKPLTYLELQSWSTMTHTRLLGWESELLMSLDRIFRKVLNG